MSFFRPSCFTQDVENARQQEKVVIWCVLFVWLNQTDQMNQINKTNQFEPPCSVFVFYSRCAGLGSPRADKGKTMDERRINALIVGGLNHSFYSFAFQPKTITPIPNNAIPAPVQSKIERSSPSTTFSQTRAVAT